MALNLGLILGSALAGAADGGGGAVEKMGASMQDAQQKQDLVRMQAQLDEQKQMRIQEAEHNFQNQFQSQAFAHADTSQQKQQDFQSAQTDKTLSSEEKRSAANNATSIQVAGISAAASRYMSDARITAEKELAQISRRGQSLFTAADGKVYNIQNNMDAPPTVTPVMDPTDPTKQMIGQKNLDQSSILMAQSLMAQSKQAAADGDTKTAAELAAQAQRLLTPTSDRAFPQPTDKAVQLAKSGGVGQADYDRKFGPGAFARDTGKAPAGQSGTTTNPFTGGGNTPGLPGTPDTGAGTSAPPLIQGQMPTPPVTPPAAPVTARNPAPTPAAPPPVAAAPAAPYQPSALIAGAMTPQQGPPPTQQAFKQQLDAFGRPIPQGGVLNPIGL